MSQFSTLAARFARGHARRQTDIVRFANRRMIAAGLDRVNVKEGPFSRNCRRTNASKCVYVGSSCLLALRMPRDTRQEMQLIENRCNALAERSVSSVKRSAYISSPEERSHRSGSISGTIDPAQCNLYEKRREGRREGG